MAEKSKPTKKSEGHKTIQPSARTLNKMITYSTILRREEKKEKSVFLDKKLSNTGGTKNYDIRSSLGKGGFAEVFLAVANGIHITVTVNGKDKTITSPTVALKVYFISEKDEAERRETIENITQENSKLMDLKGRTENIVRIIDYDQIEIDGVERYYTALEFCPNGELTDYANKQERIPAEILYAIFSSLNGLKTYHNIGELYVHKDIKSENILIGENGEGKVSDFGLSIIGDLESQEYDKENRLAFKGTPHYMSPEICKYQRKDGFLKSDDMWAYGQVLIEMLSSGIKFADILYTNRNPTSAEKKAIKEFKHIHKTDVTFLGERKWLNKRLLYTSSTPGKNIIEKAMVIIEMIRDEYDEEINVATEIKRFLNFQKKLILSHVKEPKAKQILTININSFQKRLKEISETYPELIAIIDAITMRQNREKTYEDANQLYTDLKALYQNHNISRKVIKTRWSPKRCFNWVRDVAHDIYITSKYRIYAWIITIAMIVGLFVGSISLYKYLDERAKLNAKKAAELEQFTELNDSLMKINLPSHDTDAIEATVAKLIVHPLQTEKGKMKLINYLFAEVMHKRKQFGLPDHAYPLYKRDKDYESYILPHVNKLNGEKGYEMYQLIVKTQEFIKREGFAENQMIKISLNHTNNTLNAYKDIISNESNQSIRKRIDKGLYEDALSKIDVILLVEAQQRLGNDEYETIKEIYRKWIVDRPKQIEKAKEAVFRTIKKYDLQISQEDLDQ